MLGSFRVLGAAELQDFFPGFRFLEARDVASESGGQIDVSFAADISEAWGGGRCSVASPNVNLSFGYQGGLLGNMGGYFSNKGRPLWYPKIEENPFEGAPQQGTPNFGNPPPPLYQPVEPKVLKALDPASATRPLGRSPPRVPRCFWPSAPFGSEDHGSGVKGLGFRVQGLGFRVKGLGF